MELCFEGVAARSSREVALSGRLVGGRAHVAAIALSGEPPEVVGGVGGVGGR